MPSPANAGTFATFRAWILPPSPTVAFPSRRLYTKSLGPNAARRPKAVSCPCTAATRPNKITTAPVNILTKAIVHSSKLYPQRLIRHCLGEEPDRGKSSCWQSLSILCYFESTTTTTTLPPRPNVASNNVEIVDDFKGGLVFFRCGKRNPPMGPCFSILNLKETGLEDGVRSVSSPSKKNKYVLSLSFFPYHDYRKQA